MNYLPLMEHRLLTRLALRHGTYRITLMHPVPPSTMMWPKPRFVRTLNRLGDRRSKLASAIAVLKKVADQDADHARQQNGKGFSKSDSPAGHLLSKMSPSSAAHDPSMAAQIMRMAKRYHRQASELALLELRLD